MAEDNTSINTALLSDICRSYLKQHGYEMPDFKTTISRKIIEYAQQEKARLKNRIIDLKK